MQCSHESDGCHPHEQVLRNLIKVVVVQISARKWRSGRWRGGMWDGGPWEKRDGEWGALRGVEYGMGGGCKSGGNTYISHAS